MNDELINQYSWLIKSIAYKFYNVEYDDLFQAGCLGLIKAFNNYKDESVKFSSYAYKYIFGEMYDLSIKCRDIKLNKYYLKLYKLIIKTKSMLTQKNMKEVSLKEISDYLNIDIKEIEYTLMLMESNLSLDDEYLNIQISNNEDIESSTIIKDSIDNLDSLSSAVINYRLNYDLTQSEVAKLLGISQVKVSRIEKKSKNKILELIS